MHSMPKFQPVAAVLLLWGIGLAGSLDAQAPATTVTWGGYVDAYYAYDFGRPAALDRNFTTQAARHNEFNVNLAFVEAILRGDGIRGRLALQAGTSVHANYAAEPAVGAVSGPSLARSLQEAFVGVQFGQSLWVDAGVFFSNVGVEGWIPVDNLALTRSLTADFSPYYSAGVRASWQASPRIALRVDLINGWQNISESNADKAVATRLDFTVRDGLVATHYTFVGNEVGRARLFSGIGLVGSLGASTAIAANVDVGQQAGTAGAAADTWVGGALQVRRRVSARASLIARGEWFNDPGQVLIATGAGQPAFRAAGGSLGIEVAPRAGVTWRNELRVLSSPGAVFPDRESPGGVSGRNMLLTSALAMRF